MEFRKSEGQVLSDNQIKSRTARNTIIHPFDISILTEAGLNMWNVSALLDKAMREKRMINEELVNSAEGKLIIRRKKGQNYYSMKKDDKERGITDEPDLVNTLARKRYLIARREEIAAEIELHNKHLSGFEGCHSHGEMNEYLKRMIMVGYDITKIIFSKEQNDWINGIYTPNPYHQEHLIHKTESGLYVRSYGELNIAKKLERRGIPYRYDDIVQIVSKKTGKSKTYFADFKIPNLRGGISMLEHLGGFGFEGYSDNAIERLNAYSESGMFRNEEIFWSFDSTVNDPEQLDRLINRMLLPY